MLQAGEGLKVGRVCGVDLYLDRSLLLVLVVVGFWSFSLDAEVRGAQLTLVAALFFSVFFHEVGHAIAARWMNLGQISIRLTAFGGQTRFHDSPAPRGGILVALAGPGAGLALGLGALVLERTLGSSLSPHLLQLLSFLVLANLVFNLGNLLPILPLDGGQVLRYALLGKQGVRGATRAAVVIGLIGLLFSSFLMVVLYGPHSPLLWFLVAMLAVENFRLWSAAGG